MTHSLKTADEGLGREVEAMVYLATGFQREGGLKLMCFGQS